MCHARRFSAPSGAAFLMAVLSLPLLLMSLPASLKAAPTLVVKDIGAAPKSLNPTYGTTVGDVFAIIDLYEGLTSYDRDGEIVLRQAHSHEISDDGLVHTFELRRDALWSDGVPVTAHDYVEGIRRIVTPDYDRYAKPINTLQFLENADEVISGELPFEALGVKALGDYRLEFRLRSPITFFPSILTWNPFYPVPEHAIAEWGDDWADIDKAVTNGAYHPVKALDNGFLYAKSPTYWDAESVYYDEVEIHVKQASESYERLMSEERVDVISYYYGANSTRWFSNVLGLSVNNAPMKFVSYMSLNHAHEPLSNRAVRAALSLAMMRQRITMRLFEDRGSTENAVPAYTFSPASEQAGWEPFTPAFAAFTAETRIEQAQALMREAGYGPGNRLPLELSFNGDEVHWNRLAFGVRLALEPIFVDVRLKSRSGIEHAAVLQDGRFELALASWGLGYDDPSAALYILQSHHVKNYGHWQNANYDALFSDLVDEADRDRRRALIHDLESLILEEVPLIPLTAIRTLQIYSRAVDIGKPNFNHVVLARNIRPADTSAEE